MIRFKGGVHPDDKKSATRKKPIEEAAAPKKVTLPMLMHTGSPCRPTVEVGDYVKMGQKIAESDASLSAPVHASVSGTVIAVEKRRHPCGEDVLSVVIENDFRDEKASEFTPVDRFHTVTAEELAETADEAGIVGLGGAAFPLSAKIKSAVDKVDTLIVNGAECEPYITSDNRMMIEYTEELYDGANLVARTLGVKNAYIAVESNKPDAIEAIREVLAKKTGVKLCVLHTKYPQGSEKQLIRAVCGREVPPGGLPADIGVFTMNVTTAIAVSRAVREGRVVKTKVVTVAGSAVANPKNLLVRIGTPIGELFDACGGFLEHPEKIIMGGPMMGLSQSSLDVPVVKGTNAVLAFSKKESKAPVGETCIRCGKCVSACPMRLMPLYILRAARQNRLGECKSLNVEDCTECGACSYICPARLPLVAEMRAAKQMINSEKESAKNEDRR